jgi:hypothetical protein
MFQAGTTLSIPNFSCTDPDDGDTLTLRYVITSGDDNGHFHVVGGTGLQFAVNYDIDTGMLASRSLGIICLDSGDMPSSTAATVSVTIIDINDETPTFVISDATMCVNSSNLVGELLLEVSATDADAVPPNNMISYSILGIGRGVEFFSMHPTQGNLYLQKTIDYNQYQDYTITLRARDAGLNTLTGFMAVHLHCEAEPVVLVSSAQVKFPCFTCTMGGIAIVIGFVIEGSIILMIVLWVTWTWFIKGKEW